MRDVKRASARCGNLYVAERQRIVRIRISHSHVLIIIWVAEYQGQIILFNVAVILFRWFPYNYSNNNMYFSGGLLITIEVAAMVAHRHYFRNLILKFQPPKQEDCSTVGDLFNTLRPNRHVSGRHRGCH